jgi:hypothetical protein
MSFESWHGWQGRRVSSWENDREAWRALTLYFGKLSLVSQLQTTAAIARLIGGGKFWGYAAWEIASRAISCFT